MEWLEFLAPWFRFAKTTSDHVRTPISYDTYIEHAAGRGRHGLSGINRLISLRYSSSWPACDLYSPKANIRPGSRVCKSPTPYSTTFGTRKKWPSAAGALRTTSSGMPPSVTSSLRFFISSGVTDVIGSTPSTFTAESSSTNAKMALSSPLRCSTSSSATAMRARCAIRRTVVESTDIGQPKEAGKKGRERAWCGLYIKRADTHSVPKLTIRTDFITLELAVSVRNFNTDR